MPKKAHFPHVNAVKRRDGTVGYYYHRPTGQRLPDDYGSAAFAKAWAEAEAQAHAAHAIGPDPGTYGALVASFKASEDWARLRMQTRKDYTRLFQWMENQGAGDKPARALSQARCEKLLDLAVRDLGWRRGLYILQVNRRLYNWVLERSARRKEFGDNNPWSELPAPRRPKNLPQKHRPWEPWELRVVLEHAPLGLRRAYVLGASGMDGGTAIKRLWSEYRHGAFGFVREKTGVEGFARVLPFMQSILEEGDKPSEHVVTNLEGKPFNEANTFQTRSSELLIGLSKRGLVGAGLTFHGLRHTIGKAMADSGASLHAIQDTLQHSTAKMALHYSSGADKRRARANVEGALESWYLQNRPASVSKTKPGSEEKAQGNNG